MNVILIHGMGRTPLSMLLLAARLRAAGLRPKLFAYFVTIENWQKCIHRLHRYIQKNRGDDGYVLVGHSLGGVLARAVLPQLDPQPQALFLLASPTKACAAARRFSGVGLYKLLCGEMGQLLAQQEFMRDLPQQLVPTKIYAGTAGPTGRFSPFGGHPNDGILTLDETSLPDIPVLAMPWFHTYIMNSKTVAQDIGHASHLGSKFFKGANRE